MLVVIVTTHELLENRCVIVLFEHVRSKAKQKYAKKEQAPQQATTASTRHSHDHRTIV